MINQAPLTKGGEIMVPFRLYRHICRGLRYVNAWHMVKRAPVQPLRGSYPAGYHRIIPVWGLKLVKIAESKRQRDVDQGKERRPKWILKNQGLY
jgi:hypothetical protein